MLDDIALPPDESNPTDRGGFAHCATRLMVVPEGGGHVRSAELPLPRFTAPPSVSITFVAAGPATPLVLYSLKINELEGRTQIAVEGQTLGGVPNEVRYYCTFCVTGVHTGVDDGTVNS